MPEMTLGEIAKQVGGILEGEPSHIVNDVAELATARENTLSFLADSKNTKLLENTNAGAVLVTPDISAQRCAVIKVENPHKVFFQLVSFFRPYSLPFEKKVYDQTHLGEGCSIESDVMVGPFTAVGHRTVIRSGSVVYSNVYIGEM